MLATRKEETMIRKIILSFSFLVFLVIMTLVQACTSAPKIDEAAVRAYADPMTENVLQAIGQNDYSKFSQDFNEPMKDAMTPTAFTQLTALLQSKVGNYQSKLFVKTQMQNGFTAVIYSAKFSNEPADVVVTVSFQIVNGKNLVGGFFLNSPKLAGK
jgi:hypothetical protein